MKNLSIVVCIFLFVTGCNMGSSGAGGENTGGDALIPGAGAEDYTAQDYEAEYKMWENSQTNFTDADKTDIGDTNMCWAAVAANILAWAGWAADEDDTFDIFRDHFNDEAGYVYDALDFYFDNYVSGVSAESVSVRETRSHKLMDFIVSALHDGKGVALKIARPDKKIGHFLSVYGYRYLEEEDNFILYFTDSDDGYHQMRQFHVVWNDAEARWDFEYPYKNYYLEYVISLAGE